LVRKAQKGKKLKKKKTQKPPGLTSEMNFSRDEEEEEVLNAKAYI
jgi:hypothetical protein